MLIVVTRLQVQLAWCSNGDVEDPWYLYVVGSRAGVMRAIPLGVVRKQRKHRKWAATSYGDHLTTPIVVPSRRKACAAAAVALFWQMFRQPAAIAEQQLQMELFDGDVGLASLWSDIQANYAKTEPVCLLK